MASERTLKCSKAGWDPKGEGSFVSSVQTKLERLLLAHLMHKRSSKTVFK
jgi:hypothetical protein